MLPCLSFSSVPAQSSISWRKYLICGSVDHGLPHAFWCQHRPQTVLLFAVRPWTQIRHSDASRIMDICLAFVAAWATDMDLATVRPWTQTWPSVAAQAWTSPWPQVAAQATSIVVARWGQHYPQTSTWLQAAAQIMSIPVAFSGSMGYGHPYPPKCSKIT